MIPPLPIDVRIVDGEGRPLPFFISWWEAVRSGLVSVPPLSQAISVATATGQASRGFLGAWAELRRVVPAVPPLSESTFMVERERPTREFQRLAAALTLLLP